MTKDEQLAFSRCAAGQETPIDGLTKLEFFAASALTGLLASETENFKQMPNSATSRAFDFAEAMLAEAGRRQK